MITAISGENEILRQEALGRIVTDFAFKYTDMAVERLDGDETNYERMHEAVQSLPFLVERKLVVLRNPSANKEFTERFERFVTDVAETNDVVIVEPKVDKRIAYYKQLKKLTDFQEFNLLDGFSLAKYLTAYAKAQGGSLGSSEVRLLIDRVGTNQLILKNEVDKLLAYDPKITKVTIELLTERTSQSSIFELLDAAFAGDRKRTTMLYDEQRNMRVEPQQIIAMLAWQLHILALVKASGPRNTEEIGRAAKVNSFALRKAQSLVRNLPLDVIRDRIRFLLQLDVNSKTKQFNLDEALRLYLIAL